MPRAKGASSRKKRKKIFAQASGMRGGRSKLYKTAKESVMRAMAYSYRDRRTKKRDFRSLWIARISAAVRARGMSYSQFIDGLNKADIELNRKMLAELAIHDPIVMDGLVDLAKSASSSASAAAE